MSRFDFPRKPTRMDATTRLSLTLLGLVAIAWTIAVLGLVAITTASPVMAQDLSLQKVALQSEQAVETDPALNLDLSFLSQEKDIWQSDAADPLSEREDDIESCYVAAEAAYQAGAWNGDFRSDSDGGSAFQNAVSGFYADQRRTSQQGDCTQ